MTPRRRFAAASVLWALTAMLFLYQALDEGGVVTWAGFASSTAVIVLMAIMASPLGARRRNP